MVSTCSPRNVEWFNLYLWVFLVFFFFRNYKSQDSELMAKRALIELHLHFILKYIMQDNCMIFMNSILQIP